MASKKRKTRCIFPGYKWCGPGCSGPGAPINQVDSCCMRHDKCLDSGRSKCQCDREFLRCLEPHINRYSESGKTAALIYDVMKLRTAFTCSGRKH
ncbi:phospholipase [Bacillus mangrovi]|uniref:Phospholipase n=1 Tax=Metabacillus mangrovi TaxID=1491830 RepID=A0A7X2V4V9_9BACI|nr:phospholipase [Metabacillus mangrovi]MTH53536.1 phospholipase [Metabacillus mangrovi]